MTQRLENNIMVTPMPTTLMIRMANGLAHTVQGIFSRKAQQLHSLTPCFVQII